MSDAATARRGLARAEAEDRKAVSSGEGDAARRALAASSTVPRVLLQRETWRVVEHTGPDAQGVEVTFHIIEKADGHDAMGVMRWRRIDFKNSTWTDWNTIAEELIGEALERLA